jgi:hypothetical protein
MAISTEQRQAISRRNGAKSRGPTTEAGKFKSSRNSIKHGFYANVHHTPDERPEETAALRARWYADMGPKSVDEEFLVDECFQGNLRANRVHRAYRALVSGQQHSAIAPWHEGRDEAMARLWNALEEASDARGILTQLRKTTCGLSALAGEWERLGALLDRNGYWREDELETAVLLSGVPLGPTMLSEDEDAYRLCLWTRQCEPQPPRATIERLLQPANRPPGLRDLAAEELLPAAAECRQRLKSWIAEIRAELAAEYDRVWTEVEAPALARRTAPNGVIVIPDEEQRIRRASTEYRAMFYRAYTTLKAKRRREAADERQAMKPAADPSVSRRSSARKGSAGRAADPAPAAAAPAAAPTGTDQPRADSPEPSAAREAEPRNEPSSPAFEAPACTGGTGSCTSSQNEPSSLALGAPAPSETEVQAPIEPAIQPQPEREFVATRAVFSTAEPPVDLDRTDPHLLAEAAFEHIRQLDAGGPLRPLQEFIQAGLREWSDRANDAYDALLERQAKRDAAAARRAGGGREPP